VVVSVGQCWQWGNSWSSTTTKWTSDWRGPVRWISTNIIVLITSQLLLASKLHRCPPSCFAWSLLWRMVGASHVVDQRPCVGPEIVRIGPFCGWMLYSDQTGVYYRTQWTAQSSVFSAVWDFFVFVCLWNISGTTERFAPCSLEIRVWSLAQRVWMSRSKVKVARDIFPPHWKCIVTCSLQVTSCSNRQNHSVAAGGWWECSCMSFMFGKTFLALVFYVDFML